VTVEKPNALRKLLKPLVATGDAGEISNWWLGGHLLLEFLDICDAVESLQEQDGDDLSYHCEALRMRLATACNAVTSFPTPTLKHTVARFVLQSIPYYITYKSDETFQVRDRR
jgi:hypothetical protein